LCFVIPNKRSFKDCTERAISSVPARKKQPFRGIT
jgi:hypothetical protein